MRVADGTIGIGVVGLGYFGSHHARHYALNRRSALLAVVDADGKRADEAAARHGAEPLSDHHQLVGKVSAASITSSTSSHYAIARDLIDAGIHVFIEKPITTSPDEARDLIRRAAARNVLIQVGHIERFSPVFQALSNRVVKPVLIECVRHVQWNGRANDVDVVLDLMIHDIDLVLSLAGNRVSQIEASGVSMATPRNDVASARLTFENGVVASLSASRVAPTGVRTLTAVCDKHVYEADLSARVLRVVDGAEPAAAVEELTMEASDNLGAEIDGFLDSVQTGSPPLIDGTAGLAALEVADRILSCMNTADVVRSRTKNGVPA